MNYLGIDIGSLYTKFIVIDDKNNILYKNIIKTLNRNKHERIEILENIYSTYNIVKNCTTGYGRKHFKNADIIKTELYCASAGVSVIAPFLKTIIDIGGEDIKLLKSGKTGRVIEFYMSSKCAAGTGAYISEVADRAEIDLLAMSDLASKSKSKKELNSFCTVFAKTEIMKWIFDEIPIEDIARGIYISVAGRIKKIPTDDNLPIFLIGGVVKYHHYMKIILEEKLQTKIIVPQNPQIINAFGAAYIAKINN